METLLEQIQLALTNDATPEVRAAGAKACRAILVALETNAGEALAASPPLGAASSPETPPIPAAVIQAAVTALRGVPVDQLLDLAISRLRTMVPAEAGSAAAAPGPKFQLVHVPAER